jgi:transcriptional regulator with XRE-family HTH domain
MEPNQIIAHFKENLAKIRINQGFSQRTLAKKMSVSQRVISYYEKDAPDVPLSKIIEFSNVLGVSVLELLDTKIETNKEYEEIDVRIIRKIRQIEKLPRRTQDALWNNINTAIEMNNLKAKNKK